MRVLRFLIQLKKTILKKRRPALDDLSNKLDKYLDFDNGFFIEAGANDGYTQSNTFFLEKEKNWTGLLIEGMPELFIKCLKQRPNSIVKNFALVADDYDKKTVTMHYADLMSVVDGSLKSKELQKQHIERGLNLQHLKNTYSLDVPAKTLEAVLDSIPDLPRIDFLSLDVEGYELNVLKGLNLTKYRPKFILVEARFFQEVHKLLSENDYKLIEKMSKHDYLYQN
jgi:FkbM family methyltransferase